MKRLGLFVALISLVVAPSAQAAGSGWWGITVQPRPSLLQPGHSGTVALTVTNLGDAPISGAETPVTITDALPPGTTVNARPEAYVFPEAGFSPALSCSSTTGTATCTFTEALQPYDGIEMFVPVVVAPDAASGTDQVTVSGGQTGECHEVGRGAGGFVDSLCLVPKALVPGQQPDFELTSMPGADILADSMAHTLTVGAESTPFGVQQFEMRPEAEGGAPPRQAGGHPFQLTTTFVANTGPETLHQHLAGEGGREFDISQSPTPRDYSFQLPAGLIGNVTALPKCTVAQFNEEIQEAINRCPAQSVVGVAVLGIDAPPIGPSRGPTPIFNLTPAHGEPARFGFELGNAPVVLDTSVRTGSDYGVTVSAHNVNQTAGLMFSQVSFWGDPGSGAHYLSRGWECLRARSNYFRQSGACQALTPSTNRPLLTLPTACAADPAGQPLLAMMTGYSWAAFELPVRRFGPLSYTFPDESGEPLGLTGCASLDFRPSLQLTPEAKRAASPTALDATVHIPQQAAEIPEGTAPSDLKDTTVILPKGVSVNPSSANGLGACSEAQIGYRPGTSEPAEFTPGAAECPDASKIGTVEIKTPLLDHPIGSPGGPAGNVGAVYVAKPHENPFDSLLAIYIAVDDPVSGTVVKLPGKVEPDPQTGQLTTTFADTPQLPFEDFVLRFFGGPRAALKTPDVCGTYTSDASFVPWSGTAAVASDPSFRISQGPGGGACPTSEAGEPNGPAFSAGTLSPLAGQFSPFVLHLSREDGSQQFSRVDTTLPEGLLGRLAGVPYCPDSALTAAAAKSGRAEQASPSCPAASQVGTVTVGAGAGPQPYYTQGTVYLAGPYKGAPVSLAIVTPAVAGPYDLGTVVVRAALDVDPETARVTAKSDPIPSILQGIPLDVRSIAMHVDRPDFTLNPTNCTEMSVGGSETSTLGQAASLTDRFQTAECAALPFRPNLKIQLKGSTRRIGHPALKAVVSARPGEANIGRAQVNLPHGEFLDQGNLNKTCTRPVLRAGNCPKSSVYGHARAWTPLLEKPLQGPVYLVGGYGYKLPALVAELNGQIRVLLVGKVDSGKNHGIRSTFEAVPDAPVSRFVLQMKGGKKYGLLENSENLCKAKKSKRRAIARFTGQNGKVDAFEPVVRNQCGKQHRKSRKKAGHHRKGSRKGSGKR